VDIGTTVLGSQYLRSLCHKGFRAPYPSQLLNLGLKAIAEVVVRDGVPDVGKFVERVEHRDGELPNEVLFCR